jgi:hypothetical protein
MFDKVSSYTGDILGLGMTPGVHPRLLQIAAYGEYSKTTKEVAEIYDEVSIGLWYPIQDKLRVLSDVRPWRQIDAS